MSVIPLIVDGPNRTVTTDSNEYSPGGNLICILRLQGDQLRAESEDGNTSYDLRIGAQYLDHRYSEMRTLQEGDEIELSERMAVIIQTEEEVHLTKSAFGIINPKVTFLERGVANISTKVDAGYAGTLWITVFNLGHRPVKLKRRDKFCALTVFRVEEGGKPYRKGGKRVVGHAKPQGLMSKMLEKFPPYLSHITAILLLLTAVSVGLSIYNLFKPTVLVVEQKQQ